MQKAIEEEGPFMISYNYRENSEKNKEKKESLQGSRVQTRSMSKTL